MICLGISEDMFDSGVALLDGEKIIFASNEERYTRRKNEGGFPHLSLAALLSNTGIVPSDIERICVCGHMTPPLPIRMFPFLQEWFFKTYRSREDSVVRNLLDYVMFHTPVSRTRENSLSRKMVRPLLAPIMRNSLPRPLRGIPISFSEHHTAHAAGAWFASGFEETLCITADGMGDGLSMSVSRASVPSGMERLWSASAENSFGLFFEIVAQAFNFVPCRDEGKITGLAATGNHENVRVSSPFSWDGGKLKYSGPYGRQGVSWIKEHLLSEYNRSDISAWAQNILENAVIDLARYWLRSTGLTKLAVAGGVFANVKLNQRLHELDEVQELFVLPNMGDGGLSLGSICDQMRLLPKKLSHVFFGESYTRYQIENVLRSFDIKYEHIEKPDSIVARLLSRNLVVGRFQGAMEWGPRALGNRSILVRAVDSEITGRLNKMLSRSDFMPFAPALPKEDALLYCEGVETAKYAAEFMTVCFRCTEKMRREHAPVVHVDGTARSQLVCKDNNPSFHRVLLELKQLVGSGVVLNTSFNIHEEPIVRTPEQAVTAFLKAGLDALVIGDFLAMHPHSMGLGESPY